MTPLTLAMRNELARDPELQALLGSSTKWPQWVFVDKPQVKLENTEKALIVISTYRPWAGMNLHNTQEFPTVIVDIYADPTRNSDNSVQIEDAELKIAPIAKIVKRHFHTVNMSGPNGQALQWGTQAQVDANQGQFVSGSHLVDESEATDLPNIQGAQVASYRFGVNLVS